MQRHGLCAVQHPTPHVAHVGVLALGDAPLVRHVAAAGGRVRGVSDARLGRAHMPGCCSFIKSYSNAPPPNEPHANAPLERRLGAPRGTPTSTWGSTSGPPAVSRARRRRTAPPDNTPSRAPLRYYLWHGHRPSKVEHTPTDAPHTRRERHPTAPTVPPHPPTPRSQRGAPTSARWGSTTAAPTAVPSARGPAHRARHSRAARSRSRACAINAGGGGSASRVTGSSRATSTGVRPSR